MTLPSTIPAAVTDAAARFGGREALVDDDMRLTFEQLAAEVERAGRAYIASGIAPGDRIAIWAPNLARWAIAALGVYAAGGVVVPLNTRFKGAEAAYVIRKSGARLLVTVTDFLDTNYIRMLDGQDLGELSETVTLDAASWEGFGKRAQQVNADELSKRTASLGSNDLSDILFTSGTTGAPKGAMLTHGSSVRAYDAWSTVVGLTEGDRYLVINPFFHSFGLKAGILASLLKGATIVPHLVFDVPSVLERVGAERISMLPGPPTIYQTMLDHPELSRFDLSSLRLAVTGAASIPVELIRRMRDELPFENVVTGYGLTEATGIATMCRHDDDAETIATTCGRAIPGVEVKTVDDDGKDTGPGQPGEVVIRGYNVMKGYFNDPDATSATIDADGWLHSGDIGVFNDQGNLRITDRKKDMFIVGGFNAYPAEIENIMSSHPAVGQVAVVGTPDHRMGEVGVAFVVRRPGREVTAEELIAWSREHMANYKVPRRIEFVDALPLNASGKVLKYELRERLTG